jgi:glycosyltransferase involved in cell wall biosynthesis
MSYGLPVVVTAVGGLTEAAERYQGAILVPPGDVESLREALRTVGASEDLRYEDPFSWTDSARQLASLFDDRRRAGSGHRAAAQ